MSYEILPFPAERKVIVDAGYLGARRHIFYGLVEVDVTQPRQVIQQRKAAGEDLSFTAYLVACLARVIEERPQVQAMKDWRGRLVVFHDVDVATLIEPAPGRAAIPHIIREANRKPVAEVSREIRSIQSRPERSPQSGRLVRLAPRLPRWVRMLFYRLLMLDPQRFRRLTGTVTVTSVGMFGRGGAWGITFLPMHTLGLTVGGIVQKPGVFEGQIAIREYVQLTAAFDHDVVDGAPAARFARRFVEMVEEGALLD